MSKYKICVYAISKNESKFVNRWYNSVKEADEIYVLDTGSTDDTVTKLKSHNINVTVKEIIPWRFDVARNESLKLVPKDTDICVCTDLDEVLEPGWRNELEKNWTDDTTQAVYNYNWAFNKYNKPSVTFYYEKIHNLDYTWFHPVHEILKYIGKKPKKKVTIETIVLNHYPDLTKSRSSYLPLLELSVKEDPKDDRNMHYLGREYMYYHKWQQCIDTLIKYLSLDKATWKDERGASMRYIARSYKALNNLENAKIWLEKAINETPYLREPYTEYGLLEYDQKNYQEAIIYLETALKIKNKHKTYINEIFCWDATIYDTLSICYDRIKDYKNALYNVTIASILDPDNERIQKNKKIIEKNITQTIS